MIYLASDHAGFPLKKKLTKYLKNKNIDFVDLGTNSTIRVNFPEYAKLLTDKVTVDEGSKGILICGTGIGMSISANRNKKIRAALCKDVRTARLARQHNDANVLVLAGWHSTGFKSKRILKTFLKTEHLGGIYQKRMTNIDKLFS